MLHSWMHSVLIIKNVIRKSNWEFFFKCMIFNHSSISLNPELKWNISMHWFCMLIPLQDYNLSNCWLHWISNLHRDCELWSLSPKDAERCGCLTSTNSNWLPLPSYTRAMRKRLRNSKINIHTGGKDADFILTLLFPRTNFQWLMKCQKKIWLKYPRKKTRGSYKICEIQIEYSVCPGVWAGLYLGKQAQILSGH